MAQTFIEKIAQRFAVDLEPDQEVHSGDYLSIKPAYVMTHDNTGAVIPKFHSIGATSLRDPGQVVITIDHDIQNKSEANLQKYAKIEKFAETMGADFYPAGRGIGHQILVEEGYAWPGTLVVASDSHANMYGGIGCLGTPVVRTDAASIWATGQTWWQVPPVARVILKGNLKPGVTGKDIIISLCGFFNKDEVLNHVVEFDGEGVVRLSIEERLTISNMTTEWGALAGVFPIDHRTLEWLRTRTEFVTRRGPENVVSDRSSPGIHPRLNKERIDQLEKEFRQMSPDEDAYYARELWLDLSSIQPHISGPNSVKVMTSVAEIRKRDIKINKAYLVSCVNSRLDDLAAAATVVRDKKVAEGVEFYVAAASSEVQAESEKRGDWGALVEAGAIPLPPGCGPCIGLGRGTLQDGEVGISATNRNFRGRMGSREAEAYLASPVVVAASAIAGRIDYPGDWEEINPTGESQAPRVASKTSSPKKILDGFPEILEGELLFSHQDNLNTDGIYPSKYTYIDDFKPEQQAQVVMENYDPEFVRLAREGDILVGGFNFGTGSSREQAATALIHKGFGLAIAGSFSETYKRNALNNGFLTIEAPELVRDLKARFGEEKLTLRTGMQAKLDFRTAKLSVDGKEYAFASVGTAAQEIVIAGGLENWVKARL